MFIIKVAVQMCMWVLVLACVALKLCSRLCPGPVLCAAAQASLLAFLAIFFVVGVPDPFLGDLETNGPDRY